MTQSDGGEGVRVIPDYTPGGFLQNCLKPDRSSNAW